MLGGLDYRSIATRVKQALAAGLGYVAKGDIIIGTGTGTAQIKTAPTSKGYVRLTDPTQVDGFVDKAPPSNGYVRMADSSQSDGWLDVPFLRKNVLINGAFQIDQRTHATNADDTYAHDRWYALTQTNTIAITTQTDVENGLQFMARLTQSQAVAQRMGYAQIIEGKNCKHLRGKQVTFKFSRVRISASQAIRYAVLEWTGTEDSVTSDVVNDWTSADYTDGAAKFFVDANLTPLGNTSHTPGAATLTDGASLTVTVGNSANNLIVLAWTEATAAQNVTLDLGKAQLEEGSVATDFERRPIGTEQQLCDRYYQFYDNWTFRYDTGIARTATTSIQIRAPMRATPTFSGTTFGGSSPGAPTCTTTSASQQGTTAADGSIGYTAATFSAEL